MKTFTLHYFDFLFLKQKRFMKTCTYRLYGTFIPKNKKLSTGYPQASQFHNPIGIRFHVKRTKKTILNSFYPQAQKPVAPRFSQHKKSYPQVPQIAQVSRLRLKLYALHSFSFDLRYYHNARTTQPKQPKRDTYNVYRHYE